MDLLSGTGLSLHAWEVTWAGATQVPDYELQSVYELPLVLLLGVLCGLVATTFQGACAVTSS